MKNMINAKIVKLFAKTNIQDVGFRDSIIKNNLNKYSLKGIIYNLEDDTIIILVWGDEIIINNALIQMENDAKQKDILFSSEIEDLSVDAIPPRGVFILEDTEIEDVRKFDNTNEDINKLDNGANCAEEIIAEPKHYNEWNCKTVTILKEGNEYAEIKTNYQHYGEIVSLKSISDCIKIYGIKLILRNNDGREILDGSEIKIQKQKDSDKSLSTAGINLAICEYKDLKGVFTPDIPIRIYSQEKIALYFKTMRKDFWLEDVMFKTKICTHINKPVLIS